MALQVSKVDFRYGDAGDRIPVRFGDIWECHDARIICGDLEMGHAAHLDDFDHLVCDPPWNAGNARAFRTKAGVGRPVDFDALLGIVLDIARRGQYESWLEIGKGTLKPLTRLVEDRQGQVIYVNNATYYNRRPCLIVCVWFPKQRHHSSRPGIEGIDEMQAIPMIINAVGANGETVCDPCTGQGLMAVSAIKSGLKFTGLELNPRRMAVTLDKIAKLTGEIPRKTGEIPSGN